LLRDKVKGFGEKMLKCFYDNVIVKGGIKDLPPFEFILKMVNQAQGWVTDMIKVGPDKALEQIGRKLMTKATKLVGDAIQHVMSLRQKIRELLVLKADDPLAENKAVDDQIRAVLDLALNPLEDPLEKILSQVIPAGAVKFI